MGFLLTIHTVVCVLLIIAILLQVGRGASTGAAFGGGVRTVFGPTGATTFLGKAIIVLTVIFIIFVFLLGFLARGSKPPKLEPGKKAAVESVIPLSRLM